MYTPFHENIRIAATSATVNEIPINYFKSFKLNPYLLNKIFKININHIINIVISWILLCENNSESMFITLWLGIYNRATKKLTFSNARHNPPLLKENGEFRYLEIDSGIVLGIMNDFEYINEEITLENEIVIYTDGITDANNNDNKMYGEDRLLNFF